MTAKQTHKDRQNDRQTDTVIIWQRFEQIFQYLIEETNKIGERKSRCGREERRNYTRRQWMGFVVYYSSDESIANNKWIRYEIGL